MRKLILAAVAAVLCTSASAQVACSGKDACAVMWQRAQLWIAKNSEVKIQTATDVLIQTFGAESTTTTITYTVTREPVGVDSYTVEMQAGCGNWFGCGPKPVKVQIASFYEYIQR